MSKIDNVNKSIADIHGGEKKTLYDTNNDSGLSKFARCIGCRCCGQKVVVTTESINVSEWHGCSHVNKSMDIDNIKDIQLQETFGCCLLCCKHGDVRIYGQDADQKEEYFTCYHIENAGEVFLKLGEVNAKINDMKFGIRRHRDPTLEHVLYNSGDDGKCVKFTRCFLCCGCARPTTVITKSGITTTKLEPMSGCKFITKRMDFDRIKDIQKRSPCMQMCCGAGTLRIYGQDEDQTDEYFDVEWVSNTSAKFATINDYWNKLNNRDRVGFEQGE